MIPFVLGCGLLARKKGRGYNHRQRGGSADDVPYTLWSLHAQASGHLGGGWRPKQLSLIGSRQKIKFSISVGTP